MSDTVMDRAYKMAAEIRRDTESGQFVDLGGRIAIFASKEIAAARQATVNEVVDLIENWSKSPQFRLPHSLVDTIRAFTGR